MGIKEARSLLQAEDVRGCIAALGEVIHTPQRFTDWAAADRLLTQATAHAAAGTWARRTERVAVLSSHTGDQLTAALRVAGASQGLAMTTYTPDYRSYEREIIDPSSALYGFEPGVVVLAIDQREVRIPQVSADPSADVAAEVSRWRSLWHQLTERTGARIVMTTFVPPHDDAMGNYGATLPGARRHLLRRLNLELADAAFAEGVFLVDAEEAAMRAGGQAWFDSRYWYLAKEAVGLGAVPQLALQVNDVVCATLGLSRRVVVTDLDNTLWGGVIGEDGLAGISLGNGAAGEAHVALQAYLKSLTQRGLVLAVCSKNNPDEARLPFEQHPDMVLKLDDFVAFEASWDPKPQMIQRIAERLNVGRDALVFIDDNPAERAAVRHAHPEVGVVEMPAAATGYLDALASFPGLQTTAITDEDLKRTQQYRARAQAQEFAETASSPLEYLTKLDMCGTIEPLSEVNRTRIVQLIGKTNQMNLTTRRHDAPAVQEFAAREGSFVWGVRVADRFDDHGLIAVLIAVPGGEGVLPGTTSDDLVLDTFLMSCRVLGRTVEQEVLAELAREAEERGYRRIVAEFIPTARNAPARDILPKSGYRSVGQSDTSQTWELVFGHDTSERPGFVRLQSPLSAR